MVAVRTASICITILALAGCANSGKPGAGTTTSTASASWSRPAAPPDPRGLLSAGATAVAAVPAGTLTLIRSQESGTWKVLVVTPDGTQQAMDVSSDDVTVIVGPTPTQQSDADKATQRTRVQATRLDYRGAVDKMLAAVPNGSITRLELGDSNGVVWEADVWDTFIVEHEVTVNAVSGELLQNKQV